jgi:hypothetical protein
VRLLPLLLLAACSFQPASLAGDAGGGSDGASLDAPPPADASDLDASDLDASDLDASDLDAGIPDAQAPDAPVPDAALPDARVPDAVVPDAMPGPCEIEDLVACWEFEDNLLDGVGNLDGTAIGTPAAYTTGQTGKALNLAANTTITIGASTTLAVPLATLEAWVRPTAVPAIDEARQAVLDTNGQWGLFAAPGGAIRCSMNGVGTIEGGVLLDDTPAHIACSFDGQFQRLYLDGAEVNAIDQGGPEIVEVSAQTAIGGDAPCPSGNGTCPDRFQGRIDNVRIFNRARTDAEIFCDSVGLASPCQ